MKLASIQKNRRARRGYTLPEMVISIALFATLLMITVALLMVSVSNTADEQSAAEFQQGIDDLIFDLLMDMKSAEAVVVSGDEDKPVLEILCGDQVVIYEVNNLKGEIYKNRGNGDLIPLMSSFWRCYFDQEDDVSFALTLWFDEDNCIQYIMRCGSPVAPVAVG